MMEPGWNRVPALRHERYYHSNSFALLPECSCTHGRGRGGSWPPVRNPVCRAAAPSCTTLDVRSALWAAQ
eukprot:3082935-Alexandrium_andersonii.AAC.1